MVYNTFDEWLEANTHQAHEIIERRIKNAEGKETLEDTILWCEHEIEQVHKILGWLESATKEVCTDEQYKQVQNLYMTYMHNDFVINSPWGAEMFADGKINAVSEKFIINPEEK